MIIIDKLVEDGIRAMSRAVYSSVKSKNKYASFMKDYLKNYCNKYSTVKTFLFRGKQIAFEKFYYPLKARSEERGEQGCFSNAETLLGKNIPDYITIIGEAGGGKSTFLKHLFMDVIRQKRMPMLIELRSLEKYNSIADYLFDVVIPDEEIHDIVKKQLANGGFVLFFDGYDELQNKDKEKMLGNFIDSFHKNKFILTSRPAANVRHLERFENYILDPLEDEDVGKFVQLQLKNIDEREEIQEGLLKSVAAGLKNENLSSFLHNPLLLSIYILTYQNNPDIPEKKYLFYQQVITALIQEHDAKSKPGFIRQRKSDLDRGDIEQILKKYSYKTYMGQKYIWDKNATTELIDDTKEKCNLECDTNKLIDDMVTSLALWVEDEGDYSFSHRSFQEYFACNYIAGHERKESIYEKILRKLLTDESRSETGNLLSLLEEKDMESFTRYFKLPLFQKVKEMFCTGIEQFAETNILHIYSFGTIQQKLPEYKSSLLKLNSNQKSNAIMRCLMAFEVGVKAIMGMGMGMSARIGMRLGMGMEMDTGMGMGMNMGVDTGMGMGRAEYKGTIKKYFEGRIKSTLKEFEEDNNRTTDDILKEVAPFMYEQCQRIPPINQVGQTDNTKIDSESFFTLPFLLLVRRDLYFIEKIPFINGRELNNVIYLPDYSNQILSEFTESKKDTLITYDKIPNEIKNILIEKMSPRYEKYKHFIEKNIRELKEEITRFNTNNDSDLAEI